MLPMLCWNRNKKEYEVRAMWKWGEGNNDRACGLWLAHARHQSCASRWFGEVIVQRCTRN